MTCLVLSPSSLRWVLLLPLSSHIILFFFATHAKNCVSKRTDASKNERFMQFGNSCC
jgi:hypothetical protein